jgi:CHAT domain-containing protein/Flp pilus assembly protein TadD
MRILFAVIFVFVCLSLQAQKILQNMKKAVTEKIDVKTVEQKAKKKSTELVFKELAKNRAEFDSTDFAYALLLNDNSEMFDVKEKGETSAKFYTLGSLGAAFYKNVDFTDAENARFNLETGEIAYGMGRFVFAEKRFKAAKSIFEKAGLVKDLGYLKSVANEGLVLTTMGRYTQAEGFTSTALNMRKTELGETNIGVASSLNNYGVLHYELGHYNEAEKYFASALSLIDLNKMQSEMPSAIVLNNQAIFFQSIGRYQEAIKALQQAISIAEKIENTKSKNHLKFLSNLALLYQQINKTTEAESIYLGMEKLLGKNTVDYANMLNNLAALYIIMHKEDKVEDLLKRASSIYKSAFGENSPAYAKVNSDLGNFYRSNLKYEQAQPLLEQTLSIREQVLGKNHPLFAQSQEDLAILYWKNNSLEKAYALYHEVMEKSLDFINRYFPPMSEAEKTKYWDLLSQRFLRFYNFALDAGKKDKNILIDLYEYRIATKGILLNSTRKIKQSILEKGDDQLKNDYLTWIDHKEELTNLYEYSRAELKEQNIDVDSLELVANALEKKLSEQSQAFSDAVIKSKIRFAQVNRLLKDNEAILEIIRLRNYDQNFSDDCKYIALVINKESEVPKLTVLENGLQLETQFSKSYRFSISTHNEDKISYDQYWAPLEPAVKDKKVIYLSADGVYEQLNLYTLKKPGADYVINRYQLILLGNSKDLVSQKNKKAPASKKNAVLLGFPEYGSDKIPPLPGTKTELNQISKILKTSGYNVSELIQKNATEKNLKSLTAPQVLHIATHGFFLQDVEQPRFPFGIRYENANENSLLRSGLILAGATNAEGKDVVNLESNDNGVLTAYEAMNLNLEGTALVVLSACETGLGEVKAGEGVYGLQRAFLVAGTDALIMSLWKVDDNATQELMTNFYSNLAKLGNKQKAFKEAQLELMAKYKDPYYWGGFVMMGQ